MPLVSAVSAVLFFCLVLFCFCFFRVCVCFVCLGALFTQRAVYACLCAFGAPVCLCRYKDFERAIHGCSRLFKTWDEEVERFRTQLRMQLRQNPDPNMRTLKILHPEHRPLQERIEELRTSWRLKERSRGVGLQLGKNDV